MEERQIVNLTRGGTVVGSRIQIADTLPTKFVGLMGKQSLDDDAGLFLKDCTGIHTCWMRIPIDVLYLDAFLRVIEIDVELKPWRIGSLRRQTRHVLELPAGALAKCEVLLFDQLDIVPQTKQELSSLSREFVNAEA